ncbi:MAG: pitrilysin family protein [Chloroflexi bacterium]|nr:pitrilysin family protein [Chloroflexota bacterium]
MPDRPPGSRPVAAPAAASRAPDAHELTVLDGGLRIITASAAQAQSASVSFFVGVGSRAERVEVGGVSHYLEHMLFKGTARRPTAPEISEAVEGAGGGLNAFTTRELTCYWNRLPFERWQTGIEVLADMIQHSLLAPEEVERERTVVQQEIRRTHDNPAAWAGELLQRVTFGDQPVGRPVAGTLESVSAIDRPELSHHIRSHYTGGNAVLAVAGRVEHEAVVEEAARHFSELAPGAGLPLEAATRGLPAERVLVEERETEQTNVALAVQCGGRRDPDRYALEILVTLLGRGMSSRLFKEVRERRGLAYSVAARVGRLRDIGALAVTAGVTREQQEEALEVIMAELGRLVSEPVGEEELRRTIDYAVGGFRLSLETPMSVGQRLGDQLLQDGEIERVEESVASLEAVTAADVQRVARDLFEGPPALAVVGPSASADRLDAILSP